MLAKTLGVMALLAMCALAAWAQAPANQAQSAQPQAANADRPKFEVASIKQNKPTGSGPQYTMTGMERGGRYVATGAQLRTLIASAYQLKPDQARSISGMPDWAKSEAFDIEARAEGNPTREQMSVMLQSLLAERFKLVVHRETRQAPVYALVLSKAGKTGPQLQPHSDAAECLKIDASRPVPLSDFGAIPPPPPACGRFISGTRRLAGNNVTMEMLAENLGGLSSVDRPVVNRTGLGGKFDLSLTFAAQAGESGSQLGTDAGASDPSAPPSLFTALQEQLGLKLESQTGPVDVLVIDHVEHPSEN
jgi:uncharacterized protein (TIGR03435 family)